jgi:hypothetical protein
MDNNFNSLISDCIKKWGSEDERTQLFSELLSSWLDNVSVENRPLFIELLKKFCYYPHDITNQLLGTLYQRLLSEKDVSMTNTIYTSIESSTGIVNSSDEYVIEFKHYNRISKYLFFDNIRKISEDQWEDIHNIVFIDDCSGSGDTFYKYLQRNKQLFVNKQVYLITVHIMEDAYNKIKGLEIESNLKIKILYGVIQKKAFAESLAELSCAEAERIYINESKKNGIPRNHILGYENSESLMAFYNNTPNNTLGFFWYDNDNHKSIFPRQDDVKPPWYMKNKKKERNAQNYNNKIRSK